MTRQGNGTDEQSSNRESETGDESNRQIGKVILFPRW
jgi:hypothetical protein